ncbi:MAG: hypothetical protein ACXITV_08260 [Luteibaculaceae bacterium]
MLKIEMVAASTCDKMGSNRTSKITQGNLLFPDEVPSLNLARLPQLSIYNFRKLSIKSVLRKLE